MLIDRGGANLHKKEVLEDPFGHRSWVKPEPALPPVSVVLSVVETHDGVLCDCIDAKASEMVLSVGDTIELEHVCHDGRHDVVRATVERIGAVPVEHGSARRVSSATTAPV